jgi:hypothetical protein
LGEIKNKIINFDVESSEIINENSDSRFLIAKIQAFASSKNRHDMVCSEEVLQKTAPTIYDVPIIYNIEKYRNDFGSHTDPDKSLITGFIAPNSAKFERLPDGRLALMVFARISKRYSPKVVEILRRDNGNKKISVEMELTDSAVRDDGLTEMLDFTYLGACLLGESITEACEKSHLEVLSFAEENKKVIQEYEKEFSNKYYDIDFTIPQSVRKNAQKSLEEHKKNGGNATSVSLAMARFLAKNEKITPEKVRAMARFFNSKVERDALTLGFFGGSHGSKWVKEIFAKLEEADKKQLSYFGEDGEVIMFPYDSLKDAPENMKKLDGIPLTLEQVNQIAKVADGIGVTKEKNGYAIAKDQFKKTHKVENGHWVRKEKSNMSDEELVKEDLGKEDMSMNDEEKKLEEEKAKMAAEESEKERMAVEEAEKTKVASNEEEKKKEEQMATDDETKKKEENEEEDVPEKEKKDEDNEKKENMSLDANLDVAAMLAILEDETEVYKKLVDDHKSGNVNYSSLCSAMYAKMMAVSKKAQEDKDAYMAENDELKKFKADVLGQRFAFEVESTLNDVSDTMPKDKLDDVRKDSENFNLENVDIWKNKVKALAFSYSKEKKSDGINRMALSNSGWLPEKKETNKYENGWV